MGRSPCCEKVGLKKGPWTPEEDQKLLAYIEENGHGSWRALPGKAGLQRCGKSCRLRWTNYLRPDIKRGKFTLQEEQTIIQLHALLGNRWSAIATHLPKRTDNEIKNYWNTHLKKRLTKMGIDPVTHKPKSDTLSGARGEPKNAANLSHMAQWESARLEAEARLARESKLRSTTAILPPPLLHNKHDLPDQPLLDALKTSVWPKCNRSFNSPNVPDPLLGESVAPKLELPENSILGEGSVVDEEWKEDCNKKILNSTGFHTVSLHDLGFTMEDPWCMSHRPKQACNFIDGFTELLLETSDDRNSSGVCSVSEKADGGGIDEENKNYWNSIFNLVNSSANSPVF